MTMTDRSTKALSRLAGSIAPVRPDSPVVVDLVAFLHGCRQRFRSLRGSGCWLFHLYQETVWV